MVTFGLSSRPSCYAKSPQQRPRPLQPQQPRSFTNSKESGLSAPGALRAGTPALPAKKKALKQNCLRASVDLAGKARLAHPLSQVVLTSTAHGCGVGDGC